MKQNLMNDAPLSEAQLQILERLDRLDRTYDKGLTVKHFYLALTGVVAIVALLWILFP